ncbi:MAG TPA: phosphoribosylformylglycinamidine cyclo-ligase [Chloroflexota bacterium]|nr:phosphoribosylformylglycinamidine cyclo-ligase [Chloroflexota bacterium]
MTRSIQPPEPADVYSEAGVDTAAEERGMASLLRYVNQTFALRPGVGRPLLPIGYFANVIDLGRGQGLAISTDGVGTKLLVAQLMGKFDTVGIDCVAMNVNDILCVGAEPISIVDYVAVQALKPALLADLAKGLYEGARQSRVAIPGGEIAQVREMVRGEDDDIGFDLVATCVGVVATDRIIVGADVVPGDVVVGMRSSGIHSNGLTLARDVLLRRAGYTVHSSVAELERTIGEELLVPTRIYVAPVLAILASLTVKALIHVTSDGFLNLLRIGADVGFELDYLPDPPPIFALIKRWGQVPDEQMYSVFNMGIGFCVVLPESDATRAISIAAENGVEAFVLGRAVAEPKRTVRLFPVGLEGQGSEFHKLQ